MDYTLKHAHTCNRDRRTCRFWLLILQCTWRTFVEGSLYISDWCTVCKDWIKPWMLHRAWTGIQPADLWPISERIRPFVCYRSGRFLNDVLCACVCVCIENVSGWICDHVGMMRFRGGSFLWCEGNWTKVATIHIYTGLFIADRKQYLKSCVQHSWLV